MNGTQSTLLKQKIDILNEAEGFAESKQEKLKLPCKIIVEDIPDIPSLLVRESQSKKPKLPHAALIPADIIGYSDLLNLKTILRENISTVLLNSEQRKLLPKDISQFLGVPILRGNNLVQYTTKKNIRFLQNNFEDYFNLFEEKQNHADTAKNVLGIQISEPYTFLPYYCNLINCNSNFSAKRIAEPENTSFESKLAHLVKLSEKLKKHTGFGVTSCSSQCLEEKFINDDIKVLISGDWSEQNLRAKFGEELILSPLPSISRNKLESEVFSLELPFFLIFPGGRKPIEAVVNTKEEESLRTLARYFVSTKVQKDFHKTFFRKPMFPTSLNGMQKISRFNQPTVAKSQLLMTNTFLSHLPLLWPALKILLGQLSDDPLTIEDRFAKFNEIVSSKTLLQRTKAVATKEVETKEVEK